MITDKIIKNTFVTYGLYPKGIFGLIYFVGLNYVGFQAFFTPATKISWRIFSKFWGNGYAAKNPLTYEFDACSLQKIVSFYRAKKLTLHPSDKKIGIKPSINGVLPYPRP